MKPRLLDDIELAAALGLPDVNAVYRLLREFRLPARLLNGVLFVAEAELVAWKAAAAQTKEAAR